LVSTREKKGRGELVSQGRGFTARELPQALSQREGWNRNMDQFQERKRGKVYVLAKRGKERREKDILKRHLAETKGGRKVGRCLTSLRKRL